MVSVKYQPTCGWHQTDRAEVALAIKAEVKGRYENNQPLTELEVMDVVKRLTTLLTEHGFTLEANREKILHGIGTLRSMDEITNA